jgi:hypothetical protein
MNWTCQKYRKRKQIMTGWKWRRITQKWVSSTPHTFGKTCTWFWKRANSWKKTLQGYTMNGSHKLREECKNKLTPICPKYTYRQSHDRQQLVEYSVSTGPPWLIRGGAGKSLARPTSQCRRTESIVSLERGVYSSLFLLQRLKGIMSGDARDFKNIETRAVNFPPPLKGRAPKEIHGILR